MPLFRKTEIGIGVRSHTAKQKKFFSEKKISK